MHTKRLLLVVCLLAATLSVVAEPAAAKIDRSWSVVQKTDAGFPLGASFDAVASTDDGLLVAAYDAAEAIPRAAIWRSDDGLRWTESTHPVSAGLVSALATDDQTALAIGGSGLQNDPTHFVWKSVDGGRTWTELARGSALFGEPAPEMGRPFVDGLLRHGRWWIASGGRSDGYAAIWISRDGTRWRQVLGGNAAGGATVVPTRDGSLLAYWTNTAWYSEDGTKWTDPSTVSAPPHFFVNSVARGARVAFADDFRKHGQPTPLLRSKDGGSTWKRDRGFLDAYPDAVAWKVARVAGLWVAAGSSGDHVDAWASANLREWFALPAELHGGPGGALSLVAAVGDRIVVMGTAPELDRYYILD